MDQPVFFLSLYNKDAYEDVILDLSGLDDYRLVGTEGTASWCQSLGVSCDSMSDFLDLDPRLDGQVKTLHPDLYSGLLATSTDDLPAGIPLVNGVIVDLTPFRDGDEFLRKKIDIGGVSLLRAAVKNYEHVIPLSDPASARTYLVNRPLSEHGRKWFASQALQQSVQYDKDLLGLIDETIGNGDRSIHCSLPAHETLRYGENPSQEAHYRGDLFDQKKDYELVAGDDCSYTNLLDVEAARNLVGYEDQTQVSVVKHTNPTGWASGNDLADTFERAWNGDPKSAFGGVVGVNVDVTVSLMESLGEYFVEAIVAPAFHDEVVERVSGDERPRLIRFEESRGTCDSLRSLSDGYLTQSNLDPFDNQDEWELVTEASVSESDERILRQMWWVCRWVTSNAVVLGTENKVLAVGAGQQSRVDAVEVAVSKLSEHHPTFDGPLMMASDGFFPFPDNIEIASQAGVDGIISPGGSVKDDEVIHAANDHDIAMLFTGQRVFDH